MLVVYSSFYFGVFELVFVFCLFVVVVAAVVVVVVAVAVVAAVECRSNYIQST